MNHLKHTYTAFDAVICLSGNIPDVAVFEQLMDRPLIAVDGAATVLYRAGIVPEYVVGDFDSVDADVLELLRGTSEIVVELSQETNDFEKALVFATSMHWKRLLIVGIHGGDLEHTLNNWSVLMRLGRDLSLVVLDQNRFAVPLYDSFTYSARPDELISLIPQPTARLTATGLKWSLDNEELSLGMREGARNRAVETQITVKLHSGAIFFFCEANFPLAPELMQGAIFDHSTIVADGS